MITVGGGQDGHQHAAIGPGLSFVLDPPKFCCVISSKSAQISQNFRAVTACGQRHHKFELLFPQLFERGAEDYVDRGRRGVAGRARSGVQAPGHSLQPIVSVIPAVNDATSGGTASGRIWIHGSATRNETRKFLESWPLSFLRAGPPKSRKKAGESRTHPNLETNFAKLRPGPTSGTKAESGTPTTDHPPPPFL